MKALEEFYTSKRWRRKREIILKRDNYTCQWCKRYDGGKTPATVVHHIKHLEDYPELAYKDSGALPVVMHTNKAGATNYVKNPALALWNELNKSALAYWRDLGLTPAGLKRINETMLQNRKGNALEKALKDLGS